MKPCNQDDTLTPPVVVRVSSMKYQFSLFIDYQAVEITNGTLKFDTADGQDSNEQVL